MGVVRMMMYLEVDMITFRHGRGDMVEIVVMVVVVVGKMFP